MNKFEIVKPGEAFRMAATGEYIVVDLRDQQAYESGHIKNALSIPGAKVEEISEICSFNEKILLYCSRGNLSFQLASKLVRLGYQVWAVAGKIEEALR